MNENKGIVVRQCLAFLLASLLPLMAKAVPVGPEQARTAAGNWLGRSSALGCRLGSSVDDVRTCTPTNGARFHVVKLVGGGFVVMSADTRIEPVVAFSESNDLREGDDSPLWMLLKGDVAARMRALGTAGLQSVAPGGSSQPTAEETRWATLLAGGGTLLSAASVPDVRVEPLLKTKWGQNVNSLYSNMGANCYNYYTPCNYVCGCVATALAQLMRHHRHPASVQAVERTCAVDGVEESCMMKGGAYDYEAMKPVPEAYPGLAWYEGGATEIQRQAIGKLTYDCGVAMQMSWTSNGSGSGGAAANVPLKNVFGYASAHTVTAGLSDPSYRDRILQPNLNAGYPVMLGVDGPFGGHEILADGYGYSSSVLYTHLNMGWSGNDDAWYALPALDVSACSFDTVTHAVYNVFPDKTGEIVSGRVTTSGGVPVEGAIVVISRDGTVQETRTTNSRGIFSFIVPGGRKVAVKYVVQASRGGSKSTERTVSVRTTDDSTVALGVGYYSYNPSEPPPVCGNVLCDDLVLPSPTATATGEVPVPFSWLNEYFPGAHTASEYETLALADADGDGFETWKEYLCGTKPTVADDLPRCVITMEGSNPVVTHNVVIPAAAALDGWRVITQGSDDLSRWEPVDDPACSLKRFFKIVVKRP